MSQLRDITEHDPGRGGRGARLAVLGAALLVIAGTLIAATPHRAAPVATSRAVPTPNPYPRSAGLLDASFGDYANGFLVTGDGSAGGTLWRTSDGGQTWHLGFKLDTASTFAAIHQYAGGGYAVTLSLPQGLGVSGWWETSDFGYSFEQHPFPNPPGLVLVALATSDDGGAFALFSDEDYPPNALLFARGSDGFWSQTATVGHGRGTPGAAPLQTFPLFGSRTAMAFLDHRRGVIATQTDGGRLSLSVTADGGHSWSLRLLPAVELLAPEAVSATAVDGELIVAASFGPAVDTATTLMTTSDDGGATWTDFREVPTADGLETPVFVSRSVWWVPMGKGVLVTDDGGAHWWRGGLDLPGTTRVRAIYPIDDKRAWAFGGAGIATPQLLYLTTDGGTTWKIQKPPG